MVAGNGGAPGVGEGGIVTWDATGETSVVPVCVNGETYGSKSDKFDNPGSW